MRKCTCSSYFGSNTYREHTSHQPGWWQGQSKRFNSVERAGDGWGIPKTEDEEREGEKSKMHAQKARSRGWNDTHRVGLQFFRGWRATGGPEKIFLCFLPTPFLNSQTLKVMWQEKIKGRDYESEKLRNFPCPSFLCFKKYFLFLVHSTPHLSLFQNILRKRHPHYLPDTSSWFKERQVVQGGDVHVNRTGPYITTS